MVPLRPLLLVWAASGLGSSSGRSAPAVPLAELLDSSAPTPRPLGDADLGPSAGALPPTNRFNGRLTLLDTSAISLEVLRDDYDYARFPTRRRLPPDGSFTAEYSQLESPSDGPSRLAPVATGLQLTGDIVWNLIFTSGLAWDEPGGVDDGWSRALLPFALSERNANCVHNGLLLVAFRDSPSGIGLSNARFQITQETCLYYKVDYWGQLPGRYDPEPHATPRYAEARARDARELEARLPTAPIAQLAADYPGVDPAAFGQQLTPVHVSSLGVLADGKLYVRDCVTRTGDYAGLCDELVLPSYSLAKSIFGMGLMRLAAKFGPAVYAARVAELLPEEVGGAEGDWAEVTLLDCLDMMTGNYQSAEYQRDEDVHSGDFFAAETYSGKSAAAFSFPNREPPGQRHIYHTTDTFILASAMQNYLQRSSLNSTNISSAAEITDVWELIAEEILKPLDISSTAFTSLRTYDARAQPYGGESHHEPAAENVARSES